MNEEEQVIRFPQSSLFVGEANELPAERVKERKALTALKSSQTSSSRIGNSSKPLPQAPNSMTTISNENKASSAPFKIFASSEPCSDISSSSGWKNLGTEIERNRENSGKGIRKNIFLVN